ncbi:MAG: DUF5591 domain-containing protein [Defluviitaleaceae bacterium]|nr:DUF5591 domain-containing protein [Defluviitaleaceae bacterium]
MDTTEKNIREYPGFPEYKLLDLIDEKTTFKRGASYEHIHHNEFNIWQDYFCSEDYKKPSGTKIAFLQVCSWAKPYDFSYIGKKIREVTNRYPMVHPIILSNAGVIPYEYQMNPTFCAYDWINLETLENFEEIRKEYREVLIYRIERYLKANKYDLVVQYGIPTKKYSLSPLIKDICKNFNIKYVLTPNIETYKNSKEKLKNLRDIGEFFCINEVLENMDDCLKKVCEYVKSINNNTSL